jgi:hypothetical protein
MVAQSCARESITLRLFLIKTKARRAEEELCATAYLAIERQPCPANG